MKNEENLGKNRTFFNRWAKSYDCGLFQFWMRKFQEPILNLDFSPTTKLLDVSCGTGELLLELSKRKSALLENLFGVDFSEEMLTKAREKLSSRITLQQADVHDLPFKAESFDFATSTEAFHHYYNQEKALSELVRVTKKGGKVIVVDANFFLQPIHYLFQKLEPGCVKMNSRKEMKVLFEKAGLQNIQQQRIFMFAVMTTGDKTTDQPK